MYLFIIEAFDIKRTKKMNHVILMSMVLWGLIFFCGGVFDVTVKEASGSIVMKEPYHEQCMRNNGTDVLMTYNEQAMMAAFHHAEIVTTMTSSRTRFSPGTLDEYVDDCDILLCSTSGFRSGAFMIFDEDTQMVFDNDELLTTRTSSLRGYYSESYEDDDECDIYLCNSFTFCSCGIEEEVSLSIIGTSGDVMLPFMSITMIKHRKAWSGMHGQYGSSGSYKKGNIFTTVVHNEGGYDCDTFIWQQFCASGMPPNPGPEVLEAMQMCCESHNQTVISLGNSDDFEMPLADPLETLLTSAEIAGVPRPSGQHNGLFVDFPTMRHFDAAYLSDEQVHEGIFHNPIINTTRTAHEVGAVRFVIPTILTFALDNLKKAITLFTLSKHTGAGRPLRTNREYDLLFGGGTQHMPTYLPIVGDNHWRAIFFDTVAKRVYLIDPRGGDGWRTSELGHKILKELLDIEHATGGAYFTTHIIQCKPQGDGFQCGIWIIWFAQVICLWGKATTNTRVAYNNSLEDFIKAEMLASSIHCVDPDRNNANRVIAHKLRVQYRHYVNNPRNLLIEPPVGVYSPMQTMTVLAHFHEDYPHKYVPQVSHVGIQGSNPARPFAMTPCGRQHCLRDWLQCCGLHDSERALSTATIAEDCSPSPLHLNVNFEKATVGQQKRSRRESVSMNTK